MNVKQERANKEYTRIDPFGAISVAVLVMSLLVLSLSGCERIPKSTKIPYKGTLISYAPTPKQLREAASDYEAIILTPMQFIVDRYNRKPDYQWIDTKLSLISGQDFPEDDLLRGPNTIYGWIQGRSLEALVGHARWLRDNNEMEVKTRLIEQIDKIIREVFTQLKVVWEKNSGHLFFFMTPEGEPFLLDSEGQRQPWTLTSESPYNSSDVFGAKGMYAAAQYLQDGEAIVLAKDYCLKVIEAIWEGNFRSDQQALDPKNPVTPVPGRHLHGPFMISIGTAAMLAEHERDSTSVEMGLRLIRYILQNHVNLDRRWPNLQGYDFVEFIDDHGRPYQDSGRIFSDPGHSMEFVGLTLKFTSICKQLQIASVEQQLEINKIEAVMFEILMQNFTNGFQPGPGGICKHFDLVTRTPINSDMPWWSLPETMRAALFCWQIANTPNQRQFCLSVLSKCHNAFIKNYIRPELNLMAYQTRSADGSVVDTIPATPDADPGYHTGLSLLDCLAIIEKVIER